MLRYTMILASVLFSIYAEASVKEFQQAKALLAKGDSAEAITIINKLLISSPGNIDYIFLNAQAAAYAGDVKKAVDLYSLLIKKNPELLEAYNNLAVIYAKQGAIDEAKKILERGLRARKNYSTLYENYSALNLAQARASYGKAFQLDLKPKEIALEVISLDSHGGEIRVTEVAQSKSLSASSQKVNSQLAIQTSNKNNPPSGNTVAVEQVIHAWAAAWSAQAVNMYLSFYHTDYKPDDGLSFALWKSVRQKRLLKPEWIKVTVSDFNFVEYGKDKIVVKFVQRYQSNSYSDITNKMFTLMYTDSGWRIYEEKSL